jgi:hypothetical protein
MFKWNNPKLVEDKIVAFRPIKFAQNVVKGEKMLYNNLAHGGRLYNVSLSNTGDLERVPIYDYTSNIEEVGMIFVNPAGMRRIIVNIFDNHHNCNQVIWVYTTNPVESRFRRNNVVNEDGEDISELGKAVPRINRQLVENLNA